jgi:hypothetical protein
MTERSLRVAVVPIVIFLVVVFLFVLLLLLALPSKENISGYRVIRRVIVKVF